MKRLILMRHAKTEPWNEGLNDRDRMLTERGHDDAIAMGDALAGRGWSPDVALISTARRTRETWRHLAQYFPDCRAKLTDDLYLAGVPAIESLAGSQAEFGTVMVIGHNPGLHDLATSIVRLAGCENQRAALRLVEKFPTSAAALFEQEEDGPYVPVHFKLTDFLEARRLA